MTCFFSPAICSSCARSFPLSSSRVACNCWTCSTLAASCSASGSVAGTTAGLGAGFFGAGAAGVAGWTLGKAEALRSISGSSSIGTMPGVPGGSISTVYSRSKRPLGWLSCTRKFRNGSLTGLLDVTRITLRLPRRIGVNFKSLRKNTRSTPARLYSSAVARLTDSSPSSRPAASTKAISARSG
ncbi:hypothetical protein D3C84_816780 [compost metagenome]